MSEPIPTPAQQPGVITYVEHHQGQRRRLTLNLTSGNLAAGRHHPVVSIDGRRYVVVWGTVTFEIPADRNVHVSVHVEAEYLTQVASMLLPPGDQSRTFTYETHYGTGIGTLVETA